MNTRNMTDEEVVLLEQGQTMLEQLPVEFGCGFRITAFRSKCASCGYEFQQDEMRADVSDLLPTVVAIRTITQCKCCSVVTSTTHRVRSDGTSHQVEFVNDEGMWVTSKFRPRGILARLKQWIGWK